MHSNSVLRHRVRFFICDVDVVTACLVVVFHMCVLVLRRNLFTFFLFFPCVASMERLCVALDGKDMWCPPWTAFHAPSNALSAALSLYVVTSGSVHMLVHST